VECLTVEKRYHIGDVTPETKFILVEPYDGLRVTYRAHYPPPIGIEEWTYEHHSGASYREAIAPARTFAFVEDVEQMHEAGLIPGGRLNNVILIGKSGIVNSSPLRFANEFVRHKILDIIGDLYLLGRPIRGHVRANMTGHTENVALVRSLQDVLTLASYRC
jgi:UDP-3-O-acyl-N-acetylglucosamine deacetylase